MNRWSKITGRFLLILVWFFLIILPLIAFMVAARGQSRIGSDEQNHLRIFLLQDKDTEAIGVELARRTSMETLCIETRVRYFMWTGDAENVTFCQCIDPQSSAFLPAMPGTCNPP